MKKISRIKSQRGGLLVITLVVGAAIGMGLAALATFSTGQGEEAERRITELNQTTAIQYAIDYQARSLFEEFDIVTSASGAAQILDNSLNLKSADPALTSSCLADMPWGVPPHNPSGSVASLWDPNKESNSARLISAGTESIPGVDREVNFAFEHYGRQFDAINLDEDSWIEFRNLNDVGYDNVFFDIWFQVDFENRELFPETDSNLYELPLASFYLNNASSPALSVYTKLSICDQDITLENKNSEKAQACKSKKKKTRGIFTYHIKQDGVSDEHLDEASDTIKSIEDGYWQYASFNINLASGSATANFTAVPQTAIDYSEDMTSEDFDSLTAFGSGGHWRIADHDSIDSTSPISIATARFWRQPSLSHSDATDLSEELYLNDREKPGMFADTALGTPDAVLLVDGTWSQQRSLPAEDGNSIRQLKGSWWGPALGEPTLITSKNGDQQKEIFNSIRQIFIQKRIAKDRTGPAAPTQIYRLFTCDENGGAGRVEYLRHLNRDGDQFAVSWEEQK